MKENDKVLQYQYKKDLFSENDFKKNTNNYKYMIDTQKYKNNRFKSSLNKKLNDNQIKKIVNFTEEKFLLESLENSSIIGQNCFLDSSGGKMKESECKEISGIKSKFLINKEINS